MLRAPTGVRAFIAGRRSLPPSAPVSERIRGVSDPAVDAVPSPQPRPGDRSRPGCRCQNGAGFSADLSRNFFDLFTVSMPPRSAVRSRLEWSRDAKVRLLEDRAVILRDIPLCHLIPGYAQMHDRKRVAIHRAFQPVAVLGASTRSAWAVGLARAFRAACGR